MNLEECTHISTYICTYTHTHKHTHTGVKRDKNRLRCREIQRFEGRQIGRAPGRERV